MTKLTITPLVNGLSATQQETNHALITIEGKRKTEAKRKPVNLVLAIDVSSSMSGSKLSTVQQAACELIDRLQATDRVGVVSFGSHVEVIHNLELLENRDKIKNAIRDLAAVGSTALYPGWEKSIELLEALKLKGRVLLLSDGEANIGLVDADQIATKVKEKSKAGLSTSTMGVGSHFNEDLLEAMALSGEGNYFYVEDLKKMEEIFAIELSGVQARIGASLEVSITPENGATIVKAVQPHALLDNKIYVGSILSGMPINILVEFTTPLSAKQLEVLKLSAKYNAIDEKNKETPKTIEASLELPVVDSEWMEINQNPQVKERVAIAKAEELRQEALTKAAQGDNAGSIQYLTQAGAIFGGLANKSSLVLQEMSMLEAVKTRVETGSFLEASKLSKSMTYARSNALVGDYIASSFVPPEDKKDPNGDNL